MDANIKIMNLLNFFKKTNLENSFIIGYYGGTNFGDELLLEILQNVLNTNNVKNVSFYYSDIDKYKTYHLDYGYTAVAPHFLDIFKAIHKSKTIIIGGGGLWGLDFNKNIAILSIILFLSKFLLRKKIYLIGVGSYTSSGVIGTFFSNLTSFSSDIIFSRDLESFNNFRKFNKSTILSEDLAFLLPHLNFERYQNQKELLQLENQVFSNTPVVLVSSRHFSENHKKEKRVQKYNNELYKLIKNTKNRFLLVLLNSKEFDPETYISYKETNSIFPETTSLVETEINPIYLFLALRKFSNNVTVISPQYHMQVISIITGTKFIPISYDNKNKQLYMKYSIPKWKDISEVDHQYLSEFLEKNE